MKKESKIEYNIHNKPIYGCHYHCSECGAEMKPIQKINWSVNSGVKHLHICPKDGNLFTEKENIDVK